MMLPNSNCGCDCVCVMSNDLLRRRLIYYRYRLRLIYYIITIISEVYFDGCLRIILECRGESFDLTFSRLSSNRTRGFYRMLCILNVVWIWNMLCIWKYSRHMIILSLYLPSLNCRTLVPLNKNIVLLVSRINRLSLYILSIFNVLWWLMSLHWVLVVLMPISSIVFIGHTIIMHNIFISVSMVSYLRTKIPFTSHIFLLSLVKSRLIMHSLIWSVFTDMIVRWIWMCNSSRR